MKLVEAEEEGPVEGDHALVTPPRPPHRRVSVSLLFTLTVLTGTVITIYMVVPARNNVLVTEAIERHREEAPVWDLTNPSRAELRAWALAVVGGGAPLPELDAAVGAVTGARSIEVLDRRAALLQLTVGSEPITYLVQHTRGIAPEHTDRTDGDLRAIAWYRKTFTTVIVGRTETAATWLAALRR